MTPEPLGEGVLVIVVSELPTHFTTIYIRMKIIVTEEQYNRVINQTPLLWIKRRYELVLEALKETEELMVTEICRINDYESFETKFFAVLIDCLHPYLYVGLSLNHVTYDEMNALLKDLFYVECTEFYFGGRKNC